MSTQFTNDFSEEIWRTTYKAPTDVTVDDTFMRVAKGIASVEKNDKLRTEWSQKFFEVLTGFKLTTGGRIYSNAGSEWAKTTLINCYLGPRDTQDIDSVDGIIKVLREQLQTLKSEGGWGMNFSFIRPRGAFIYGIGVETPGAVKYMELFDKGSEIITAGSGLASKKRGKIKIRKGAMMGVLDVWHPDIEEFITAKQTPGRLTKFNMSVNCTDEFMQKVIEVEKIARELVERTALHKEMSNDKSMEADKVNASETIDKLLAKLNEANHWDLIFPETTAPQYKKEWTGNIVEWKKKGYPIKVYKTTTVTHIWNLITTSTYNRNEPGVLFADVANRTHAWNYGGGKAHIAGSNPCLSGDTMVYVADGRGCVSIKELADKNDDVPVFCLNGEGLLVVRYMRNPRKTQEHVMVYKVTIDGEFVLKATSNHKFILQDGSKKMVRDLVRGDSLMLAYADTIAYKVVSVEFYGYEDVYNGTVDEFHNFFVGGFNEGTKTVFVNTANCGEQLLPYGGCCNLLSVNLPMFYDLSKKHFSFDALAAAVKVAVRLSDNVNDYSTAPLPEYEESLRNRRRIGLGILGWGSLLYLMKLRFGSDEAEAFKKKMMKRFTHAAVEASIDLSEEKGMFKDCNPELHAKALIWDMIDLPEELRKRMRKHGIRNSALFSIQPTGNTSIFANLVSGGCEPVFLSEYVRTSIVQVVPEHIRAVCPKYWEGEFKETKMFKFGLEGDEVILHGKDEFGVVYKIDKSRGLTKETLCEDYAVRALKSINEWDINAPWAATTKTLTIDDHVKDLIGWYQWLDSSASKTINLPNDYSYDEFKKVYLTLYKSGIAKGVTTYREGTMASVLSASGTANKDSRITKTNAPKRPDELPCQVHHTTVKGKSYYAVVGMMCGDPYEIFTGNNEDRKGLVIPKEVTTGMTIKRARGNYELVSNDYLVDGNPIKVMLTNGHSDENADALTRMMSCSLRHGADILFVVQQLEKTEGSLVTFAKVMARTLKKYIPDGTKVNDKCPECGADLVRREGCISCTKCVYSKCG